ncbi:MAG: pyruvate, phosphate dikinase [Lactobacillales bacterium]|jgi:pyruvate,orthophosphate dikinase|nr:pyruvate, phosphate dikinase [Lactobacillales bacterium]
MKKFVYQFSEGKKEQADLLGGKGSNLAEMSNLGLPVPHGFTITTEACVDYIHRGFVLQEEIKKQILITLEKMEQITGRRFSDEKNPLLVSVRSGAKFSMPGMMDTILNLGLNDFTVDVLAKKTKNPVFAYDCYRRLLQMFGEVVSQIPKNRFEDQLEYVKKKNSYMSDTELTAADWQYLVKIFKEIYLHETGKEFPQDPKEQLFLAIEAVFMSWMNPRAKVYRSLHHISEKLGTAVNIQEMVFGNTGENSGTGVAFSRNPATGEKGLFGEFLMNAQGEDVVAGVRTPRNITELEVLMPEVYKEFLGIVAKLEAHYKDMQDIEFTIENKKLFILQTRNGKRTPKAAFKIVVDLVESGVLTKEEAIMRVQPEMIAPLLHPVFDEEILKQHIAIGEGLPASPGSTSGQIYFHAAEATLAKARGERVILFRKETSPDDIEGMVISEAIVTSRGGMTSHAAVVARGMGVCCVVGCEELLINEEAKTVHTKFGEVLNEGDLVSIDGSSGKIYLGEIPTEEASENKNLKTVLGWADTCSRMKVRANAETAKDIAAAFSFDAVGIGLARTEHMFFGEERILNMRKLILATDERERNKALATLKEIQKGDFLEIFALTQEKPVTVRLLDPPLHEFLPKTDVEIEVLARELSLSEVEIRERIDALEEVNPMLGHRGCRLAVTFPEIYIMQTKAIVESALALKVQQGINTKVEIMIPLTVEARELAFVKEQVEEAITEVVENSKVDWSCKVGTMIEIPRACLTADEIAQHAEFFSFGTNDLTQMTFGFSRDDAGKFIGAYLDKKLLKNDPFQTLDTVGVGELIRVAIDKARTVKPAMKLGVCGETGGDPESIHFYHEVGLDYVSCSPYRVPIARLACAQANLKK